MNTFSGLIYSALTSHGDRIAVIEDDRRVTFNDLRDTCGVVSAYFRELGFRPGDRIGVYAKRSVDSISSILSILCADMTYIPIDLSTPAERVAYILEDAQARAVLCDASGESLLADTRLNIPQKIPFSSFAAKEAVSLTAPTVPTAPEESIAYIIYTSGTSGQPKGVMISQASVGHRYRDWVDLYGLGSQVKSVMQLAKLGFDVFTGDLIKSIAAGGTLVVCDDYTLLNPEELYEQFMAHRVDFVDIVPAILRNLADYMMAENKQLNDNLILNCGADLWSKNEYAAFKSSLGVRQLLNSYGVTEATVENTVFEDVDGELDHYDTLPIGKALPSDTIVVVDRDFRVLPATEEGQLCIGGPCIAVGYLNNPERNENAFRDIVLPNGESERVYLTGDKGRIHDNGQIEFLGRIDFQVKINGNRVELLEIERAIERFEGVKQCVASLGSNQHVHALVSTVDKTFDTQACRKRLFELLPTYMVPQSIQRVESFPMTSNGKVDRKTITERSKVWRSGNRRKSKHTLYEATSLHELVERLAAFDVDIESLVNEFVKPSVNPGILVAGSHAEQVATGVSDVDILVVASTDSMLKRQRREIYGNPISYSSSSRSKRTSASFFIEGVEFNIDFYGDASVPVDPDSDAHDIDASAVDDPARAKFLSRLASTWVLCGEDIVDSWKRYYAVDKFKTKRILANFTTAAKNLEDMEAGIGLDGAHVAQMGRYVTTKLLLSLLASNDYLSTSCKWMRAATRLANTAGSPEAELVVTGQELLLTPGLPELNSQTDYFYQIVHYCIAVRDYLASVQELGAVLDTIVLELDIPLPPLAEQSL